MIDANSQFFAILTNVGMAKQANADALGLPWKFTEMGVGDANNTDPIPNAGQTHLINEWRRRPLNQVRVDPVNPAVIIAEQIIPADEGGHWIREIGLYDADGDLVAVANCAPSFKPVLSQGSGRTQVVRMNFVVNSTGNITLKIDPAIVLATRDYVDGLTARASQVEAEVGTENSKIMTPLRVFQAIAKVVAQATETAFGWAKVATQAQITTGTDDATFLTPKKLRGAQATQVEAEAGTDNSKIMTPLRVFQAIAKVVTQATETAFGWAKVATQAQVTTGTDDTNFLTPKKLRDAQATQVEAEGGTDNRKVMTPLRVFQAASVSKRIASFGANGSWTCPAGVTEIVVDASAGGAGGAGANGTTNAGEGGGGGACIRNQSYVVTPGQVYTVTIGAAGLGGALNADGTNGGVTSLGALFTLSGGISGSKNGMGFGGPGGWGGQAGGDAFALGGAGGSTIFGVGGASRSGVGTGGVGYGAGGAGGAPGWAGGNGAQGFITIRW